MKKLQRNPKHLIEITRVFNGKYANFHSWEQWSIGYVKVAMSDGKVMSGILNRDKNNPELWMYKGIIFSALNYKHALQQLRPQGS